MLIPHYLSAKKSTSKWNSFSRSEAKNLKAIIMSYARCSRIHPRVHSEFYKTIKSKSKSKSI